MTTAIFLSISVAFLLTDLTIEHLAFGFAFAVFAWARFDADMEYRQGMRGTAMVATAIALMIFAMGFASGAVAVAIWRAQ